MDLADFASEHCPLHCSRLPEFMGCEWKSLMQHLDLFSREGGPAAQTGTAMHKAVSDWHKHGKEEEAIASMKSLRDQLPLADFREASQLFRWYAAAKENQKAKVVHCECLLQGTIAPDVYLEGTCDQIREVEGVWKIFDIKTSKLSGAFVRDWHTYQLAAYAYLASKCFHRLVLPGAVIMARALEKNPDRAFFAYQLTKADVAALMSIAAARVKAVRRGQIIIAPGDHCGYCIGTTLCVERFTSYRKACHGKNSSSKA